MFCLQPWYETAVLENVHMDLLTWMVGPSLMFSCQPFKPPPF